MEKTRNIEEVFNSADELIDYLFDLQKKGEYIFRGISNREQLYPTLIREFVKRNPKETEKYIGDYTLSSEQVSDLPKYEMNLLYEYGKYSNQYLPSFYNSLEYI